MAPPRITLVWLEGSRAQRIAWLLEELAVPYEVELHFRSSFNAPAALERVHPLGKSPVVKIEPGGGADGAPAPPAIVLAESEFIAEYLCEHFDRSGRLLPPRWRDGKEGQVGGETDAWMRHAYLMHYGEGSFMPIVVMSILLNQFRDPLAPTAAVASRYIDEYILPNARRDLAFIDSMLTSGPGGDYLCGPTPTCADLLISLPIMMSGVRFNPDDSTGKFWKGGSVEAEFPRVWEYLARLQKMDSYSRAEERIKNEIEKQGKTLGGYSS